MDSSLVVKYDPTDATSPFETFYHTKYSAVNSDWCCNKVKGIEEKQQLSHEGVSHLNCLSGVRTG